MSLIGSSVVLLTSGDQWRLAVIRAASQALHSGSDLAQIRVLLEWSDYGGGGMESQNEWVNLGKPELFKSVYAEQSLLWARRVLPNEQNRAVAWPARAFIFLCGTPLMSTPEVLIVEYFCDKEKVQLYVHETKELQLSEAKATLSQQPQLLQELKEWEELAHGRDLLQNCSASLKGHRVSVYNVQLHKSWITGVIISINYQNKELTVLEDRTQSVHTVNPHMIHVMLQPSQEDGHGLTVPGGQWGTSPLSLVNSPDVAPANGSPGVSAIKSPHLTSPIIQECPSPLFNLNSSNKSSFYHANSNSSKDISPSNGGVGSFLDSASRRSSLQQMNLSLIRSEPNIHRRCSLDPITLKRLSEPFSFSQDLQSHSLGRIPFHSNSNSVTPTTPSKLGGVDGRGFQLQQQQQQHPLQSSCSPHGSNSHLSTYGSNPMISSLHSSNSSLCGGGGTDDLSLVHRGGGDSGTYYPTPEDIIKQTDRSQSLGNIYGSIQNQLVNQYHHHHQSQQQHQQQNQQHQQQKQNQQHQQQQHQQATSGGMMSNMHPQHSNLGGSMLGNPPPAPPPPPSGAQGLPGGQRRSSDSPLQTCQKRKPSVYEGGASKVFIKKPRFEMSTELSKSGDVLTGALKALSRSASQPAVFPSKTLEKKLKQLTGGTGVFIDGDSQQKHDDDLDIIKQIIETDESMHSGRQSGGEGLKGSGRGGGGGDEGDCVTNLRAQSLTHIPNQFSYAGSLPSLHHAESMHVLHANYNSAPDFTQFCKPRLMNSPGQHHGNLLSVAPMEYDSSESMRHNSHGESCRDFSATSGIGGNGGGGYGNSLSRGFAQDERMLGTQRPRQSLESVYEDQSLTGTSSYGSGGNPQATSVDLGPPPQLQQQQQQQQQQHRHSYGGGGASSDPCHPIVMTRSASLSTASYSPGFSLLQDHALSNSNPNLAPETSSVINHYPSAENLNSTSSATEHARRGPALPPPSTSSAGDLVGMANGGQTVSGSASMEYNLLGQYLGNGAEVSGGGSYSDIERTLDDTQKESDQGIGFGGPARQTNIMKDPHPPVVATEATVLSMGDSEESLMNGEDVAEYSISKVINTQFSGTEEVDDEDLLYSPDDPKYGSDHSSDLMPSFSSTTMNSVSDSNTPGNLADGGNHTKKSRKPKKPKKTPLPKENARSRGRPRLTEEEKQRRKELRELGLLKRSRRRTKEEVAQWKADKVLSPAKRGRKPGSGKKNIIKAASGKVVFVTVDLSKFAPGTILLQNGFCRAYPGVSKCLDCGTCEGDLPSSRYCRFLEFRKLLIESNIDPRVSVHGFSDYTDVLAPDLVTWTPLRANFSKMDESTALFILHKIAHDFVTVITEQAKTLPDTDIVPVWKRPVSGIRELCDTCDTSLFNFHWVCQSCGFCICPACYELACNSEDDMEAVSSMQTSGWPVCVSHGQPHQPTNLVLAQIIPANVLAEVVVQVLAVCKQHKVQVTVPSVLQRLISVVSHQTPQAKYQNETGKKSKGQPTAVIHTHQDTPPLMGPSDSLPHSLLSSHLSQQSSLSNHSSTSNSNTNSIPTSIPLSLLHPNCVPLDMPPIELPHSCSNGNDDLPEAESFTCPHQWLCDGTLLCLLDAKHNENITAFQERWRRSEPVLVSGVDRYLDKELWTPQSFSREFGEEPADLVDCRIGLHLLQLPSKTFWDGFENMNARLRDPTKNEPRLLKLKDWPTCDDFSEKLPKRFNDLMEALPLPDYTRRDGKYNMASSLPKFFVKPDLGPKMYNAYGSPLYPHNGTTNLHLDISSAVNVMVYCNIPPSVARREWELVEDVVRSECCPQSLHRVQQSGAKPGALWQIYSPDDSDKIRAFLRKVYEEKGFRLMPGNDPIHDQLIYLDSELRDRLMHEYGVKGWTIVQCVGDAVFIPAGAPHQVRNLCSCIKVAEDFVSPEHVYQCLKLTEEFRHLSDHHSNHEDKLQVKNILYHSMKDIVGALKSSVR